MFEFTVTKVTKFVQKTLYTIGVHIELAIVNFIYKAAFIIKTILCYIKSKVSDLIFSLPVKVNAHLISEIKMQVVYL